MRAPLIRAKRNMADSGMTLVGVVNVALLLRAQAGGGGLHDDGNADKSESGPMG